MRSSTILLLALLWLSTVAFAQDPVSADPQHYVVLYENAHIRVLLARYGPHEKSPIHQEPVGIAVALTDRTERVTSQDGRRQESTAGAGELSRSDVKQIRENIGDQPFEILFIEYKTAEAQEAAGLHRSLKGVAANEASATATLRTINVAEVTFAATYNKGFTDGLHRLGAPDAGQPDENNADLLDPVLAGRAPGGSNFSFEKNGYKFVYTPDRGEFGLIRDYTLIAQPLDYGVSGIRSFYTDQSAVVRATRENRPADYQDPPI